MAMDKSALSALKVGENQASVVLEARRKALRRRQQVLKTHRNPMVLHNKAFLLAGEEPPDALVSRTAGVLVAEGDSWFDYPLHDVLKALDDEHGYSVESVSHAGDAIEQMAYENGQLDDFTRRIEKVLAAGAAPKAILLSGGGNDLAGTEFGMLLNHSQSAARGLNESVVKGVIDERIRSAYVTILNAITAVCKSQAGHAVPILLHGYDYPVPDGRGFLGGWGLLPGPWMEPGFRQKGFDQLSERIAIAKALIDRLNAMIKGVAALAPFAHVRYVDLRKTLSNDTTNNQYKDSWANEMHPTPDGFVKVADRFAKVLRSLA